MLTAFEHLSLLKSVVRQVMEDSLVFLKFVFDSETHELSTSTAQGQDLQVAEVDRDEQCFILCVCVC